MRETHDGRNLWVVRKGATPAFPGQRGFVGGSMGDDAVTYRKVTGGFGSKWGTDLFAGVPSVVCTAKRRGIDAFHAIRAVLDGESVIQAG